MDMEHDENSMDDQFKTFLMNGYLEDVTTDMSNDLIALLKEYSNKSTNSINGVVQENAGVIRNIEEEQQLRNRKLFNNNFLTSSDEGHMAVCNIQERPQQSLTCNEQYYGNIKTNSVYKDPAQNEPNLQPSAAAFADPNERQINAYDFYHLLLKKLRNELETCKPVLMNAIAPANTADCFLNEFRLLPPINNNTNGKYELYALLQGFQAGFQFLLNLQCQLNTNHVNYTNPISKESNEISERTITEPSEQDVHHLSRNIQAVERSTTSKETHSMDTNAVKLQLSHLLSQARRIFDQHNLLELRITAQPHEYWKNRTPNRFKEKFPSALQDWSGKQKHHPHIKWSGRTNYNGKNWFVLAQVLSYDNNPHPSNFIVPTKTKVNQLITSKKRKQPGDLRLTIDDLNIDEKIFDKKTRSILLPISSDEYLESGKSLKVVMFRSYKANYQTTDTTDASDVGDNEEMDESEINHSIENEISKISKLRLVLCRMTAENRLEYISNFVDTELIEESKGSVKTPLKISNIEELTGKHLRRDGNENICLKLSKDSEKQGFIIYRNGTPLSLNEFSGVKNQQIFFRSVPRPISGVEYLTVQVWKKSILETLKRNLNPHYGLYAIPLLNIKIYYEKDNDNQHVDEYSNTTVSIQSNEIGPTQSII